MLRLLLGLALMPTSAVALYEAARALGHLAAGTREAAPFIGGAAACLLARVFLDFEESFLGVFMKQAYVLGHELSHAAAAWSSGGSVYGMKVGKDGGHVDLSHTSAFVALAPYCVPIYTLAVVAGYRIVLWLRPELRHPGVYFFLMGLALAFHLVFTFDSIWQHKQPDLQAAGGTVFSLSIIGLANALSVLLLMKTLFPGAVSLAASGAAVKESTARLWRPAVVQARAAFKGARR
jgi:hypothetical protein